MDFLIVESSKVQQSFIGRTLSEFKPNITYSDSIKDALSQLIKKEFDIVCVSYSLPDGDAIQFAQKVRNELLKKHIPILMLTSEDNKTLINKALMEGITEVINKKNLLELIKYFQNYIKNQGIETNRGSIVYIEDSKAYAKIIATWLTENNYEFKHFFDAKEAIEFIKSNNVDLVITDIILEGDISGFGILREIRSLEDKKKSELPVIIMTGFDDTARRIEIYRSGANDYITKPILKEELLVRIKNLVQNKRLKDKVEEQYIKLKELSIKDSLTGVYNRRFIMDLLPSIIEDSKINNTTITIVMFDIDFFKKINDTYGHQAGDIVLQQVAKYVSQKLGKSDFIARYGGEEFIIIMSNKSLQDSYNFIEDLRKGIESLNPNDIKVTCSFGMINILNDNIDTLENIINKADIALYNAKRSGRNRVEVYNEEIAN